MKPNREIQEVTPMEAIRLLSGIVEDDKNKLMARLSIICLIARNSLGDAENDFTDETLLRCGIKLIRKQP